MQRPVNSQTNTGSAEKPESVADLTARIHRLRQPAANVRREIRAAEYAILQTEFARLIACELNRINDDSAHLVPSAIIGELNECLGTNLASLESRQRQIDACNAYASDLHQTVWKLLYQTRVAPAQLQNLAHRIRLDAQHFSLAELLPDPGWMIESQLTATEWRSEPSIYGMGIQTARLLAFAAPGMFTWNDRTELLIVAALLQDIGLLMLERQYNLSANQLAIDEPTAFRQHPSIGAAVSAALTDYAVDLPTLIAQHHERCDGIGYPHGDRSDRLAAPSRFLAIVVRFVELMQDEMLRGSIAGNESKRESLYTTVARRLLLEAEQGELDQPLAVTFLQRLDLADVKTRTAGRFFQLSRFRGKRFRRDDAVTASTNREVSSDGGDNVQGPAPSPSPKHLRRSLINQTDASRNPD